MKSLAQRIQEHLWAWGKFDPGHELLGEALAVLQAQEMTMAKKAKKTAKAKKPVRMVKKQAKAVSQPKGRA